MNLRILRYLLSFFALFGITFMLQAALPPVVTGMWAGSGNLSLARSGACSILLGDGRVLVMGGEDNGAITATVDQFSTSGIWSTIAPMNSARSHHSCVLLQDGRVLVAGGTVSGGTVTNSAEVYDANANSWTQVGVLHDARSGATLSMLQDGRVLIAGGEGPGGALNTVELFYPAAGTFSHAGTLSSPRQNHAAAVLRDGRVLIVGGSDGADPLASSELFDPSSETISAGPSLNSARSSHSATALLNGQILIIGGTGIGANGPQDLSSAELFDPSAGVFTVAGASLSTPREGHQAFLLPNNNSVLIVGGTSNGTVLATSELFGPQVSPSDGSWAYAVGATGSNVTTRTAAAGSVMEQDGLLLSAGGTDASGKALTSSELYAFATVKTDEADYAPGTIVTITGSGWTPGETVTLTLVESPLIDTHPMMAAVADANGNISNSQFSPDSHDADVRFWLTAVGSQSGVRALNTFTDAVKLYEASISPVTDTAGHASSYTLKITNDPTSTNPFNSVTFTVPSGYSSIALGTVIPPAGQNWSASLSSGTITLAAVTNDKLSAGQSITVALAGTAPCTDSSYTWTTATSGNFILVGPQPSVAITGSCDKTAPVITPNVSGTLGDNGWYVGNVSVSWTVTDPESSITSSSGCGTTNVTADTTGTNLTCTATSAGGTSSQSVTIKRDATPPTGVSGAAGRSPDHNGWYNAAVAITFSGTDSISGMASCTTTNYSGPDTGSASVLGHCTDNAGNASADVPFNFKFDSTAPTAVALSVTAGTAGANGWYTSDVSVHTSGTETVSTPLSCTADQSQTAETVGQIFNGSCTNDAGLSTNASPLNVKLDKTRPTAELAVSAGTAGTNGWYTSDVTVHASGTETISSPVTCTADQFLTTDTAGHVFSGSCTNDAGLTTNAADLNVKLDKTPPTVNITPDRAADHNSWYNHSLTFTNPGSDSTSGIESCTTPAPYSGPDTGTASVDAACTDKAGNVGHGSFNFMFDATPPSNVTGAPNRAADHNGWFNHAVDVVFSGNEATSGIESCTTVNYSGPDAATASVNGSCTDIAGNTSAPVASSSFKFDSTPPTANLAVTAGTLGAHGWYTTDVTVTTSGSDTVSNPTTCTADQYQTMETTGTLFTGSCINDAGLKADATPLTVKLDKTGPSATLAVTAGNLGTNGWYTSDVTVQTSGADSIATPVVCTTDQVLSTETAGVPLNGSCTNDAGLKTDAAPLTIKLDKTPPIVTLTPSGTQGTNNWFTSDVTIHTAGSESISTPVTCSPDQFQISETTGAVFTGSCTNDAGLKGTAAQLIVKLDKTAPSASVAITGGTLGSNGWYTSNVTVSTTGDDSISKPVICTAAQIFSSDSAGQQAGGTCTNDAGLHTDAAPITFKLDKTPPTATLAVTVGTPGTNGWYTSNVTVHASGTDNVSSQVTCTADQYQITETPGTLFNGSCTNDAGLTTAAGSLTVKLDKTGPTAVLSATGTAGLNGWYVSDVTVSTTGTDSISSPVTCTANQSQTTDTTGTNFNGSCTNDAGLHTDASPLTIKRDSTPPVVNVTGVSQGAIYTLAAVPATGCSTSDATSGVATNATLALSGGVAPGVGSFTATCSGGADRAGNAAAQAIVTYKVQYATAGICYGDVGHQILQPINATAPMSVFKAGSTVPTKFRVCDANGVSIGTPGVVVGYGVLSEVASQTISVNELPYSNTPDTAFRWDSTGQQWIFNQATKNNGSLNAGGAYAFGINLNDGTWITFQYGLK